jgi:hypothetical protein
MEEHDISACALSAPASANNATGQEAGDIARRTHAVLAEIISKHRRAGTIAREKLAGRTDQLYTRICNGVATNPIESQRNLFSKHRSVSGLMILLRRSYSAELRERR